MGYGKKNGKMRTLQEDVLLSVWMEKGEVDVKTISKDTNLSERKIHKVIKHLLNRRLIKKRLTFGNAGYKKPPRKRLLISINKDREEKIRKILNK